MIFSFLFRRNHLGKPIPALQFLSLAAKSDVPSGASGWVQSSDAMIFFRRAILAWVLSRGIKMIFTQRRKIKKPGGGHPG